MNAPFDPVSFIHRLEAEGIARGAAEAIAQGIEDRNRELATKQDLVDLVTKSQLEAALSKVIIQVGGMLAASIALIVAILGTIIALH